MAYERELGVALEAAALAGKLILEDYAAFKVIPDAPADISTDTDRRSQETIIQYILTQFPQDGFCAEENTGSLAGRTAGGPRRWVIDPIDGTRGFARKNDEFSVMIALMDSSEIALGVVAEPALSRLTYAVRGGRCWRRDGDTSRDELCQVTQVGELAGAVVTQSHSRKPDQPSRYIRSLNPKRVIETYSAGIKLAQVARGEADLYLNTYDASHDWDICAGQILVEEAGGKVTNLRGQNPVYGQPESLQPGGLLASNGLLHEAALAAVGLIS